MDALHGCQQNVSRKSLRWTIQGCCEQYYTNTWAKSNKAIAVRSPTTYHERYPNYTNHTCGTQLEKRGRSDILQWTSSHERAKAGRPARTNIVKLCANRGCSLKDLQGAIDDKDGWWVRVREIRAGSVTCWWWWWWYYMEITFPFPPSVYILICFTFDIWYVKEFFMFYPG